MTQKVGRRSHGGVYRKTEDISTSAAAAIGKWRFVTEIHRQTACVKFTRDERTFYWHPVAKKFRREGESTWSHLPSGRGVVALMLHLHGKEELLGIPHFAAMIDGYRPVHQTNTDNPIDFPSAASKSGVVGSAGSASPATIQPGESHRVGHSASENSRVGSAEDMARWAAIDERAHSNNAEYEAMQIEGSHR